MLINNCEVKCDMSYVRSVINERDGNNMDLILNAKDELSFAAIPEQIKEHRKSWSENKMDNSSVLTHFDYSDENRQPRDNFESDSRDILVLLIGEGSQEDYERIAGGSSLQLHLMTLTGSKSMIEFSSAYENDSVRFKVIQVGNKSQMTAIKFQDYFCIAILDSSNSDQLSNDVLSSLVEKSSNSNYTMPLIYNFSYSMSQLICNLDETVASSVATSWFCATSELQIQNQLDYMQQAITTMFHRSVPGNKNIFNECRLIMNENCKEYGESGIDAILESCNLTTCGNYYPYQFFQSIISTHRDGLEALKNRVLPPEFATEDNPRLARENWLIKSIDILSAEAESDKQINRSVRGLIALHQIYDKEHPDHNAPDGETRYEKIIRLADKINPGKTGKQIKNLFVQKKVDKSKSADKGNTTYIILDTVHGGRETNVKLDHYGDVKLGVKSSENKQPPHPIFDALKNSETLSKNFTPMSKNWDFIRALKVVTNLHKYRQTTTNIKQYESYIGFSRLKKVTNQIIKNLILHEFVKFIKGGGVVR